jgi:galactokinase
MDQLASASGQSGHALLIDCRSLETRAVPIPPSVSVVVLDTATRRGLVDSAYNERRSQCDAAARALGVRALRDVSEDVFAERERELDPVTRKRARHVVTENARVLRAAQSLESGDVAAFGQLMNASHASLRDDFEVSRRELDVMVRVAQEHRACFGARMTGAGFGGCAVALVNRDGVERFIADVSRAYAAETDLIPSIHACAPAAGASVEAI